MADTSAQIGPRAINDILIPGSHDSGTYGLAYSSFGYGKARAQDLNIVAQLSQGVRYLDLRLENERVIADLGKNGGKLFGVGDDRPLGDLHAPGGEELFSLVLEKAHRPLPCPA